MLCTYTYGFVRRGLTGRLRGPYNQCVLSVTLCLSIRTSKKESSDFRFQNSEFRIQNSGSGGGGDLADFRFRVSDFLGSESRKLAQIQKSKASRNQFLGSRQISWDVRFQISDFRFPSGPGQIPWAESDFRFQISDFPRGPAKSHGQNQISDFRFQRGRRQISTTVRFQTSDFQPGQGSSGKGTADFRFQISSFTRYQRAQEHTKQNADFRFQVTKPP